MKKEQLYIPTIILLSLYAIIDNGESIFGFIAAIIAVTLAFVFVGFLTEESHKLTPSKLDSNAWGDISDPSKQDWK